MKSAQWRSFWRSARRTPRGVRGLKSVSSVTSPGLTRRTPRGVRGLKFVGEQHEQAVVCVAPPAGCVG